MGAGRDDVRHAHQPTNCQITDSIRYASANWRNWRPCWEHQGDWRTHPLLATQVWFGCFVWEYGLGRTFKRVQAAELRRRFRESKAFRQAVEQEDESALEEASMEIPRNLNASTKEDCSKALRALPSLTSKVAAFLRPQCFIAWDTFATTGLRRLTAGQCGSFRSSLAKYQRLARNIVADQQCLPWWPDAVPQIDAEARSINANMAAFRMRVLDWIAMDVGAGGQHFPDAVVPDFAPRSETP